MGKRYYCDYCHKSFPYNVQNRKKHNEGSHHKMMRSYYYSQFNTQTQKPQQFDSNLQSIQPMVINQYQEINPKKETPMQTEIAIDLSNLSLSLNREEEEMSEAYFPTYNVPKSLKNYKAVLPPSLIPPTFRDFIDCQQNNWG